MNWSGARGRKTDAIAPNSPRLFFSPFFLIWLIGKLSLDRIDAGSPEFGFGSGVVIHGSFFTGVDPPCWCLVAGSGSPGPSRSSPLPRRAATWRPAGVIAITALQAVHRVVRQAGHPVARPGARPGVRPGVRRVARRRVPTVRTGAPRRAARTARRVPTAAGVRTTPIVAPSAQRGMGRRVVHPVVRQAARTARMAPMAARRTVARPVAARVAARVAVTAGTPHRPSSTRRACRSIRIA